MARSSGFIESSKHSLNYVGTVVGFVLTSATLMFALGHYVFLTIFDPRPLAKLIPALMSAGLILYFTLTVPAIWRSVRQNTFNYKLAPLIFILGVTSVGIVVALLLGLTNW